MNNDPEYSESAREISALSDGETAIPVGTDSARDDRDPIREKLEGLFDLLCRPADSTTESVVDRVDETSRALQRFRILRSHAKGGLGEVWLAEDEELQRNVALKEIQPRYAGHAESRSRFLREATITGQLEHPGIVPVYAIGEHADGRPFYAMRFIEGASLQQAIDRFHAADGPAVKQRQLELRTLLNRFIDVCNAVAYAHSRGVVHRDLKPANIMLGAFGETLVVDWGLAKAAAVPDSMTGEDNVAQRGASSPLPTQIGSTIGTPAYMSPEQAAGRIDDLGPLSDVYSLGATLYCLLTGKPPFAESDLKTILQKVQSGDFPQPRRIDGTVPAALEAICLKAMALSPQERYLSPQALAIDIERWLADEAVSAYRDPLIVRASRWSRRHRALVTGASVLIFTAIPALIINNHLLKREQLRTEQRRIEAIDAERRAVANQELAASNAAAAKESQRHAEENLDLAESRARQATERFFVALNAIDALASGIQDRLEDHPNTQRLRRELLTAAQIGLERLFDDSPNDSLGVRPQIRLQLRSGELWWQIGDLQKAEERFSDAARFADSAVTSNPSNLDLRYDQIRARRKLASLRFARGHSEHAFAELKSIRSLGLRALQVAPNAPNLKAELVMISVALGQIEEARGNLTSATEYYENGLRLVQQLTEADFDSPDIKRDLTLILHQRLGDINFEAGDLEAARRHFENNLEAIEHLPAEDAHKQKYRFEVTTDYDRLGNISIATGDLGTARTFYEKFLTIAEQRADADPADFEAQRGVSVACYRIAQVARRLNDLETAERNYRRSQDISRQLITRDPTNRIVRRDLAVDSEQLAHILRDRGDFAGALANYEQSIGITRALVQEDSSALLKLDLAQSHEAVANTLTMIGNSTRAKSEYSQSVTLIRELVRQYPDVVAHRVSLMNSCRKFGMCCRIRGELTAAVDSLSESVAIAESIEKDAPELSEVQIGHATGVGELGNCAQQDFDFAKAISYFEEAISRIAKIHQQGKENGNTSLDASIHGWKDSIATCTTAARAVADLDFVLSLPEEARPRWLNIRAFALHREAKHGPAFESAELLAAFGSTDPLHWYNAACAIARCVAAVGQEAESGQITDAEKALRERYAIRAIELLEKAKNAGFFTRRPDAIAHLKKAKDFDAIRERADFQKFVADLEKGQ